MNDIHESRSIGTSPEILRAQQEAEVSRQRLESSLDRLNGVIQGTRADIERKVEGAAHKVEAKAGDLKSKLDQGVVRIDDLVNEGKQHVDETFEHMDRIMSGVFTDVSSLLDQAQGSVSRVKDRVSEILTDADAFVGRVENIISGVRTDFAGSSESILSRAEQATQAFRGHLAAGATEVNGLIERAERTLLDVSDPVALMKKNPRVGISMLLFGGILIGAFFRKIVVRAGAAAITPSTSTALMTEPELPVAKSDEFSKAA